MIEYCLIESDITNFEHSTAVILQVPTLRGASDDFGGFAGLELVVYVYQ